MKECVRCKISKPLDEFRKSSSAKDGREYACKQCRRKYDNNTYKTSPERRESIRRQMRERRVRVAQRVRDYLLEHPCVDCGLSDVDLLEFDHVRGNKVAGIGDMVGRTLKWSIIEEEIAKCEVRCLHCHRKRTIKQFGWYASLV